jgi:hypothetical protein
VVTLAEYEVTMALVGSGAEFEPGWEQYVDALAELKMYVHPSARWSDDTSSLFTINV